MAPVSCQGCELLSPQPGRRQRRLGPGVAFNPTAGEEPSDHFSYDPADPVPTWGGANSAPAKVLPMKRGARDQRITLYRRDVLTFYSNRLEAPLEVTGMLKLVLFAASSAADTDFTAKLMDVAPDGNSWGPPDVVPRALSESGAAPLRLINKDLYNLNLTIY